MTYFKHTLQAAFLLLALIGMVACGPEGPTVIFDGGGTGGGTSSNEDVAFYMAWLADCTADTTILSDNTAALRSVAVKEITGALSDSTLSKAFGNMGTAAAWGPELKQSISPNNNGLITDNLLFATKYTEGGVLTYSIGVSGTNMISPFGWFDEDFAVEGQTAWNAPSGQQGVIADGSMRGLDSLLSLTDSSQNIIDYLSSQVTQAGAGTTVRISVSGHSLGGALAPILALKIKENFQSNTDVSVEAWAYAGPTPGDSTFANYLTSTLDDYHSYINPRDVVPHAWQLDSINKICSLYAELSDSICSFGDKIVAGSIVSGVAAWAVGQSTAAPSPYQIAGTPITVPSEPMVVNSATCSEISSNAGTIYSYLEGAIDSVATFCQAVNTESTTTNVEYFLMYMAELAYQHSEPYAAEFLGDEYALVSKYVSRKEGEYFQKWAKEVIAKDILHDLFNVTNAYLYSTTGASCSCPGS